MSTAQTNDEATSAAAAGNGVEKDAAGATPRKATRSKALPAQTAAEGSAKPARTRARKTAVKASKPDAAQAEDVVTPVHERTTTLQDGAVVNTEHWHRLVSEAAYYRAQRRGFSNGSPEQDWLEAEEEVRRMQQDPRAAGRNG